MLLQFCRENSDYVNIGLNYQTFYVRSCITARRNTVE